MIGLIRIKYQNLTPDEFTKLEATQEAVKIDYNTFLASYPEDSTPLFKEKAESILYLGA